MTKLALADFPSDTKIIDHIMTKNTLKNTVFLKSLASVSMFSVGLGLLYFYVGPFLFPMMNYYQVSKRTVSTFLFIQFFIWSIGCFSSFLLADKFSRRSIVLASISASTVLSLLAYFPTSFKIFAVIRCISAFCFGLYITNAKTTFAEMSAPEYRGFYISAIFTSKYIIGIIFCLLAISTAPSFNGSAIPTVNMFIFGMHVVMLVILAVFYSDSPRNLLYQGKSGEAIKILEQITGSEFEEEVKEQLLAEIKRPKKSSVSSLFSEVYLRITIALSINVFCTGMITGGVTVVLSKTLKDLQIQTNVKENPTQIYRDFAFTIVLNLIGVFVGGVLCEVKSLGRKYAVLSCSLLSILFICLAICWKENFIQYFTVGFFFFNICDPMFFLLVSEMFPTSLRLTGLSLAYGLTKVGYSVANFLFLELAEWGVMVPYFCLIAMIGVIILSTMSLPYETRDTPLDFIKGDENEELVEENKFKDDC